MYDAYWLTERLAKQRVDEIRRKAESGNRTRQSGLLWQAWWSRQCFWLSGYLRALPVRLRERLKRREVSPPIPLKGTSEPTLDFN